MKVCTDACILGAWFAMKVPEYSTILDLGSGTGLLMLMSAQQNKAEIHGIEIDLNAYKQLKENIAQSKWTDRLHVFPGDVRTYHFPSKYDFIISNPPFFENDLESASDNEKIAKHSKQLTLSELVNVFDSNLESHGGFGILLPFHRWEHFDQLANEKGFYLTEKLLVKQTPNHAHFRAILHYSRSKENFVPENELIIQVAKDQYSEEFRELLKGYYLAL